MPPRRRRIPRGRHPPRSIWTSASAPRSSTCPTRLTGPPSGPCQTCRWSGGATRRWAVSTCSLCSTLATAQISTSRCRLPWCARVEYNDTRTSCDSDVSLEGIVKHLLGVSPESTQPRRDPGPRWMEAHGGGYTLVTGRRFSIRTLRHDGLLLCCFYGLASVLYVSHPRLAPLQHRLPDCEPCNRRHTRAGGEHGRAGTPVYYGISLYADVFPEIGVEMIEPSSDTTTSPLLRTSLLLDALRVKVRPLRLGRDAQHVPPRLALSHGKVPQGRARDVRIRADSLQGMARGLVTYCCVLRLS
ncbi:hypothetical protein VTK73DRAFT_4308 [Phialemonium thermophilum]|uniref:Uncharacterized protein n=1 Tax=Phialemonium thermophilum TaxID=223376 RepID=A0ABR3V9H3_9PEZI